MESICLNMIVKNESKNLPRLFDSLFLDEHGCITHPLSSTSPVPLIRDYVIVDTGSNDNTPSIIKKYWEAKNEKLSEENKVNGKVLFSVFKNFGENRTEALNHAYAITKSKWIMFLDADMCLSPVKAGDKHTFKIQDIFDRLSSISNNIVSLKQKNGNLEWWNTRLVRTSHKIKSVGVTHEYYDTNNDPYPNYRMDLFYINDIGDGGSKSNKFARDIALLEEGLKQDPSNARYYFYLAQSYMNLPVKESASKENKEKAIVLFKKRIEMGGWVEECWYSHYKIMELYLSLGNEEQAEKHTFLGFQLHPKRAEAIYKMCKHYREAGKNALSHRYYLMGKDIPLPSDALFLETNVYDYEFAYENSINHYYLSNKKTEGLFTTISLLNNTNFIKNGRLENNVFSNMRFYVEKLSNKFVRRNIISIEIENFVDTSPCILRDPASHRILINVRKVNYEINKQTGSYTIRDESQKIRTKNVCVITDENYNIISQIIMEEENHTLYDNDTNILGVEDVRIYWEEDVSQEATPDDIASCETSSEEIFVFPKFIGVTKQYSQGAVIGIVTGTYDFVNGKLIIEKFIESPNIGSACEKNWTVFPNGKILYSFYPLTFGKCTLISNSGDPITKIMSKTGTDFYRLKKEGECVQHNPPSSPPFFSRFRGSANPVTYKNLIFTTAHTVFLETPRTYVHYIVIFTKTLEGEYKLLAYTVPFSFEGEKIEFNVGITVHNGIISLGYSCWDGCSKIVEIPIWWLFDRLVYCDDNAKDVIFSNICS